MQAIRILGRLPIPGRPWARAGLSRVTVTGMCSDCHNRVFSNSEHQNHQSYIWDSEKLFWNMDAKNIVSLTWTLELRVRNLYVIAASALAPHWQFIQVTITTVEVAASQATRNSMSGRIIKGSRRASRGMTILTRTAGGGNDNDRRRGK